MNAIKGAAMPKRKAPPAPGSQRAVARQRAKSLRDARPAQPDTLLARPATYSAVRYLVPTDPAWCYVVNDQSVTCRAYGLACGCPRCAPQLWCTDCGVDPPGLASAVWHDSDGRSDGRCLRHTRLLAAPAPPLSEAARAEIPPTAGAANKVDP